MDIINDKNTNTNANIMANDNSSNVKIHHLRSKYNIDKNMKYQIIHDNNNGE